MASKELENLKSMSLGDHLEELRTRLMLALAGLFIGMVICLFFGKYLMILLRQPYDNAVQALEMQIDLSTRSPAEGFMVYIKTSLFFGLLISSPWVFWQIWSFVSAGLYQKEKKYLHVVAPFSTTLFVTGAIFFMSIVAPLIMEFFIKFDKSFGFVSVWTPQDYINLILSLTLVFGLAFQMPIAVVFAYLMKLVSIESLTKSRKFVILGIVIVSAMATPPEPISQISLALPLYALYEISIIACRILRRRKNRTK